MLARLQQLTTLGLLASALAAGWWGIRAGHPVIGTLGAIGIPLSYVLVLAVEFVALRIVNRNDAVPRAGVGQLLRAWWGEVRTGPVVFCWRQPFFPDEVPDDPQRHGRRGVVFIHGFVCNRGFWTPWLKRLRERAIPFVAVNLEPVFGGIDGYVPIVEAAVRRLEASTGMAPVLVCHSMGGLVVRAWLQAFEADDRVWRVVTIGTPHHGTWTARFGLAANTRQMRQFSSWLDSLSQSEPARRFTRFVCYYSHADNIVLPASSATMQGADNRHVPGVAHVEMAFQESLIQEVLELVDFPVGTGAGPNSRSPGSTTPASISGSSRSCA
jgi:pimeloyl-ACP methyl ester carboxylesterase